MKKPVTFTQQELGDALSDQIGILNGYVYYPYVIAACSWKPAETFVVDVIPVSEWKLPRAIWDGRRKQFYESHTFVLAAEDIVTAVWRYMKFKVGTPCKKPALEDFSITIPNECMVTVRYDLMGSTPEEGAHRF